MRWRDKWSNTVEGWRYCYLPGLVDLLVAASTAPAKGRLRMENMAMLVDNSVLGHSITHETGWISTGITKWGEVDVPTGYRARVCVHGPDCETEIYKNVTFMPGIAHLARTGQLELCTSAELRSEQFRQPTGRFRGYGSFDYGLFRNIQFRSVDGIPSDSFGPKWMGLPNIKTQQQDRLARSDDPLFAELVRHLGPKNNVDAWHLRTAERHGLFCFLTMDFRLRRLVKSKAHLEPFRSLRTRVMTPAELGRLLGLVPVAPSLFSYHDARSVVRADLHWPTNTRRPKSSYRVR
ncbi:conserved hypothetical protein [Mesorhizobium plurifarium]|uniref:Uncharacterized protein n=1 Tax=Mesorhizobium plurifarium TaxID=69974 RepID=A0A090GUX1_MESPL|nr:conserved hypothetical protein [Mesorhizobium plurifarium]